MTDAAEADRLYTEVWPDYFSTQEKDLFWYERLWSVLLRQLEKRTKNRILCEFGSGPGFLLRLAGRRGWAAVGVEPSVAARTHARSIGQTVYAENMIAGFPAAIATEVLEHVPHPHQTLLEWGAALQDGGHLAISVPNDRNPLQRLFGRLLATKDSEDPSRPWIHHTHLHYFNRHSLKQTLELAGFEVVWQRTSFPVELLLVLPIPRKWAWKLSRIWPAPPLLWRFGIGRHLLFVARKK